MNKTANINRNFFIIGIPFLLFLISVLLMKSSMFQNNKVLSLAVTVDILITTPLIYYFLIRNTKVPKTTVVPILIIGITLGSYFMPSEEQYYLSLFKFWVLPIVEITLLTFIIFKVQNAIRKFKAHKTDTLDFFDALQNACSEIFPKRLVIPIATEVGVIYYGFINWRTRKLDINEFTYHKKSSSIAIFLALILIIVGETVGVHFLLAKLSGLAAWILTGLSAYTVVQVLGFAKSISKRPISLEDKEVALRYGIINEARILYTNIESIELSTKELGKSKQVKDLSPLGDTVGHNVIISLKTESVLTGLYGIRKKFKVISFHLDEPERFKEMVDDKLK